MVSADGAPTTALVAQVRDDLLYVFLPPTTTFDDFADLIGVDQSVLSRFCRGLARPGLDKAVAIERATQGAVPAAYWVDQPQSGAA